MQCDISGLVVTDNRTRFIPFHISIPLSDIVHPERRGKTTWHHSLGKSAINKYYY